MPLEPKERTKILKAKWKMSEAQRAHELKLAVINAMATNEDLPLLLGALGGVGIAGITGLIDGLSAPPESPAVPNPAIPWFLVSMGPVAAAAWMATNNWAAVGTTGTPGGFGIPWSDLLKISGASFGGLCMTILMLKSIFKHVDLSEMLKGVGEVVPL